MFLSFHTGDEVAMDQKLNQYKNLDYSFPNCRECQFVDKLVAVSCKYDEVLCGYWLLKCNMYTEY